MRLFSWLFVCALLGMACATGEEEADDEGSGGGNAANDECGGDRGDGNLGDVCREDCDCASGYTCYTDDYSEQCCAEDLNDLENGGWGVDCDGAQGPPPPPA